MKFLAEYFYYTRAERNGALILAALILLAILAPRFYPLILREQSCSCELFREEVAAFLSEGTNSGQSESAPAGLFTFDPNTLPEDSLQLLGLSAKLARTIVRYRERVGPFKEPESLREIYTLKAEDYERLAPYIRIKKNKKRQEADRVGEKPTPAIAEAFPFDPNTITEANLIRLGISPRVASNILKYREKGGRFRDAKSFSKIYGLNARDYERLEPYIHIGTQAESTLAQDIAETVPSSFEHTRSLAIIDINRATAEEWEQLRGIGPGYARRIVAFRDKLGGFTDIDQIAETYGLPDSTFQSIRPQLSLSPVLRKLKINEVEAPILQAHPYLNWKQANAIIAYRANHGPFQSIEDLKKVKALPEDVLDKLEAYLAY
ncbi:MAG: helix-hairpin-helix domain-containing protein [Phaeodactylibacter sp.]|nr:helix-hairpin-helix domain-containing protein [Phaeodactylibacter sp.]MCB9299268.1 helix-hairpin-helix domain-containing protein [Lewinellaceae bacterium]